MEFVAVGCDYPRALLAAVLERVQPVEGHSGDVFTGGVDAKDAAVLSGTRQHSHLLP